MFVFARVGIFARLLCGTALFALVWASSSGWAADPQPYAVTIASAGVPVIDDSMRNSSLLVSLRESAPVSPFGLIARARGDVGRVTSVLNSFGYYAPKILITIAGRELDDAGLPRILDETPQNSSVNVSIAVDKGPLYHLRNVAFEGAVPPAGRAAFGLSEGAIANSADVVTARNRLLAALQEDGYALATVDDPVAYADDEALALDITFRVDAGPQVDIGAISIEGLQDVNESFVRDVLTIRTGERYRPSAIEASRQALAAAGVFAGVNVRAADRVSADGKLPLTFEVQERPKRAVNLSGDYSTDLGFSVSVSWLHRNLFGNAEQLNLSAAGTGLGGSATGALGYKFEAQFLKPDFRRKDQTLELGLSAIKQSLEAYDQTAETMGSFLRRKFSPQWSGSVGLTATHDDVVQKGTNRVYELLALPLTVSYDTTGLADLLRDPARGFRASVAVTPTQSFGSRSFTFFALQASGSTYFDLSHEGRTVIALRGLVGSVLGASSLDLPPDQRLYAGGSATVRGFKYQSIGPQFFNGDPIGGASVDAATLELRQRLFGNFGGVAFVDAGQASADSIPFTGTVRVGAGAGIRYYTPIGVVRADVAVPLTKVASGDSFEVYIGLGQAF